MIKFTGMVPTYHYTDSPAYINGLDFDHIITYSLQRGADFEEKIKEQPPQRTQYLFDENGSLHWSAVKMKTFLAGSPEIQVVKNILLTPIEEVLHFLCAPVYRDAIVFYNSSGEMVSCINICLGCQYIETKIFHHINADYSVYDHFKRFFIAGGHDVEEPDKFITDFMNKQKEQYSKK